jgi:hypothetical protein
MVSKCANPACSQRFLYLHQGKIFQLTPTPELEAVGGGFSPSLYERFWLCDKCCKEMTLVWGGNEPKLVPLHAQPVVLELPDPVNVQKKGIRTKHAASAGSRRK